VVIETLGYQDEIASIGFLCDDSSIDKLLKIFLFSE
jgi:hypothetical protein